MTHLKILIKIADRHKDWKYIVQSFGCNADTAEDLVQEMYIKLQLKIDQGSTLVMRITISIILMSLKP